MDTLLYQRGLASSKNKAKGLIERGLVRVDGQRLQKASKKVEACTPIEIQQDGDRHHYVSRGGEKLEAALRTFRVEAQDKVAMDIGASTGGFTHCLLLHGARKVYAVDVGYGQLAYQLRKDERMVVMERQNARYLKPEQVEERPQLVTIDVSFISLTLILPAVRGLIAEGGEVIALVKPQFEAGREKVEKGGVVRDEAVHREVLEKVTRGAEELGFECLGSMESPLRGPAGNKEFFLHLRVKGP